MSSEHVEIARLAYAAFNRGDVPSALRHLDAEIEWHMSERFARGGRVFHGHDGVRQVLELFDEAVEEMRTEPHELIDAGDAVVAPVRISGRLRGSGDVVVHELVQVWRMRAGRAIRLDVYETLAEACAATGIEPPEATSASASSADPGRPSR